MRYLDKLLTFLPDALKAINDNPLGAVVLVVVLAFTLYGYTIYKLR
ncbi:MAG: hypothetical protein QM749_03270 [Aquabacterium sp.]